VISILSLYVHYPRAEWLVFYCLLQCWHMKKYIWITFRLQSPMNKATCIAMWSPMYLLPGEDSFVVCTRSHKTSDVWEQLHYRT